MIIPPTIFISLLALSIDEAQSHLPDDFIGEANNEIVIPVNRDNVHWMMIRIIRDIRLMEVYDHMKLDICIKKVTLVKKIEQFFDRNNFLVINMRNFPTQNDTYNCEL